MSLNRGLPRRIGPGMFRLDESLRRWNCDFADSPRIFKFLQDRIHPGQVLFDIGANFGLYSLPLGSLAGSDGKVLAFEPLPANLALLKRNIALNPGLKIEVVPAAVSNSAAPFAEFYSDTTSSSVTASLRSRSGQRTCRVANVRLDDFCAGRGLRPSFIKIDVEGAEMDVLHGARSLLETDHPLLLVEVHGFALPEFGQGVAALRQYLGCLDYTEERISGDDNYFTSFFVHANQQNPS